MADSIALDYKVIHLTKYKKNQKRATIRKRQTNQIFQNEST